MLLNPNSKIILQASQLRHTQDWDIVNLDLNLKIFKIFIFFIKKINIHQMFLNLDSILETIEKSVQKSHSFINSMVF